MPIDYDRLKRGIRRVDREAAKARLAQIHLFTWRTGLPKDGQRGELAIDSGTQQMYVLDWVPIAGIEAAEAVEANRRNQGA